MSVLRQLVLALAFSIACAGCAPVLHGPHGGSTLFGTIPPAAQSEAEPQIQPDRPDQTNAVYTVPPALVQLESGGQWTRVRSNGEVLQTPVSLRIGVGNWFELSMDTDGVTRERQADGTATQFAGASLGGKFRLWAAPAGLVLAVQPLITLPWGRSPDSGTDVAVRFLTGRDIGERFHVDGNYLIAAISTGTSHFAQHVLSVSGNVTVAKNWQPYAELYWVSRLEAQGQRSVAFDGGVIYNVSQRMAVDGAILVTLSDPSARPAFLGGLTVILGEVAGHHGIVARMRDADRRGDR